MKILVTGSSGFVGSRVVKLANKQGWTVKSVYRTLPDEGILHSQSFLVPSIDGETDWAGAFDGIECVVHCAARVHQMKGSSENALEEYRSTNTQGTLNLAQKAAESGVKRFLFLSTIKVNGEQSALGHPFSAKDINVPTDPYGLSKYEAEQGLMEISKRTGLEIVVIRPPLVYGPGVKANFYSMMELVFKGVPLPLGGIKNRRSLVYVDNLADLILTCCTSPNASGQVFLVSDNFDVSTSLLLSRLAVSMGKPNRMLAIPSSWIEKAASVIGRRDVAKRVFGNLQVDISDTVECLDWKPPVSFEQGIDDTVAHFLKTKSS